MVGALPQRGQGDAAVESAGALLADDGVQAVRRVAVLWDVERVGHGVVLRLQADLDHLHGRHDGDGLGDAGRETGCWELAFLERRGGGELYRRMSRARIPCRLFCLRAVACTTRTR